VRIAVALFPAVSLPGFRSPQREVPKILICRRFLAVGSAPKDFFPQFTRAAGYGAVERLLHPAQRRLCLNLGASTAVAAIIRRDMAGLRAMAMGSDTGGSTLAGRLVRARRSQAARHTVIRHSDVANLEQPSREPT